MITGSIIEKSVLTICFFVQFIYSLAQYPDNDHEVRIQLKIPLGNSQTINSIDISSDNKYLISSSENEIILYDFDRKQEIRTFSNPNLKISQSIISPDGRIICSANKSCIDCWDTYTGELISLINVDSLIGQNTNSLISTGNQAYISSFRFLDSCKTIIVSYGSATYKNNIEARNQTKESKGAIYVIDIIRNKLLNKILTPDGLAKEIHYSNDNRYLLVVFENSCTIYNRLNLNRINKFSIPHKNLLSAHLTFDNNRILVSTSDSLIYIIGIDSGKIIDTLKCVEKILDLDQSGSGNYLALVSETSLELTKSDLSANSLQTILSVNTTGAECIFNEDNYLIFTDENKIKYIELKNRNLIGEMNYRNFMLSDFDKSFDDDSLLLGSSRFRPAIWDLGSGILSRVSEKDYFPTQAIRFYDQGRKFITAGYSRKTNFSENNVQILSWTGKDLTDPQPDTLFYSENMIYDEMTCLTAKKQKVYFSYISGDPVSGTNRKSTICNFSSEKPFDIKTTAEIQGNVYSLAVSDNNSSVFSGGGVRNVLFRNAYMNWEGNEFLQQNDIINGNKIRDFPGHKESVLSLDVAPKENMFVTGSQDDCIILWDIMKGNPIRTIYRIDINDILSVCFSPDEKYLLSGSANNRVDLWDVNSGNHLKQFTGHLAPVRKVLFSGKSRLAFSGSDDNTIKIWDVTNGSNLATLIAIPEQDWVVTAPNGLFDASPGAMKKIYYVAGMETIELDQLKHRYYQPGLLQILLGYKKESLRNVRELNSVRLFPDVNLQIENDQLIVSLKNRGGGIGKVSLYIDNFERTSDIRPAFFNPDTSFTVIQVNLQDFAQFFNYDTTNTIGVYVWNDEGYLRSRQIKALYIPHPAFLTGDFKSQPNTDLQTGNKAPRMFGVVVGISDYLGDKIDLNFAGKDAVEFANALRLGAENYFGKENVFIQLLSTDTSAKYQLPVKQNILAAFDSCSNSFNQARPDDYLVVYLAGHGLNHGGQDGDFYYLTSDAFDMDPSILADSKLREMISISADELVFLLNSVPTRKKVLIFDVCAAGRAAEQIFESSRDLPGNVTRVLDYMQERSGIYILAGCEADAQSYEASIYGQGLLTYFLLKGMKGDALKMISGQEFVDVNTLLQYARNQVLMQTSGSLQKQAPFIKVPDNDMGYFIGRMTPESKDQICISQPKPVFLRSEFMNHEIGFDNLHLADIINRKLDEITALGPDAALIYSDANFFMDAYSLSGFYYVNNNDIMIDINVLYGKEILMAHFKITGKVKDLEKIAMQIIQMAYKEIKQYL